MHSSLQVENGGRGERISSKKTHGSSVMDTFAARLSVLLRDISYFTLIPAKFTTAADKRSQPIVGRKRLLLARSLASSSVSTSSSVCIAYHDEKP